MIQLRDTLRQQMEASMNPADAARWRELNRLYANGKVIQDAMGAAGAGTAEGNISLLQLRGAINRSLGSDAYARGYGDLNDLARAGQSVLPLGRRSSRLGVATQLYSVRSRQSWGVGDLDRPGGPRGLVGGRARRRTSSWSTRCTPPSRCRRWSRRRTCRPAGASPTRSICGWSGSPSTPSWTPTRRDARSTALRQPRCTLATRPTGSTATASWTAKREALEIIYSVPRTAGRELAFTALPPPRGQGLQTTSRPGARCARRTARDFADWPAELRHPALRRGRGVRRGSTPTRSTSTAGCSGCWTSSCRRPSRRRRRAGMALGVMHDLAVGVHPARRGRLGPAGHVRRGHHGRRAARRVQPERAGLGQPPWRPDRLAETGVRAVPGHGLDVLRHAGGVRVDHIIGLFRLWWIPEGAGPTEGTYVRYDHEAMIGILALEAHRAGARRGRRGSRHRRAVGPGLPAGARASSAPRSCGSSSSSTATGRPLRPEWWREYCLASVTTHDLPPTAGYLAGDHVRLRDRLGLLTRLAGRGTGGRRGRAQGLAGQPARTAGGAAADDAGSRRRPCRRCTAT